MSDASAELLWERYVAAGGRLAANAPEIWPLVVDLVEGAAEPDAISVSDLHALASEAAWLAWTHRPAEPMSPPSPEEALLCWRLVEPAALQVPLARIATLDQSSLEQIVAWAQALTRALLDDSLATPPRPPLIENLLASL